MQPSQQGPLSTRRSPFGRSLGRAPLEQAACYIPTSGVSKRSVPFPILQPGLFNPTGRTQAACEPTQENKTSTVHTTAHSCRLGATAQPRTVPTSLLLPRKPAIALRTTPPARLDHPTTAQRTARDCRFSRTTRTQPLYILAFSSEPRPLSFTAKQGGYFHHESAIDSHCPLRFADRHFCASCLPYWPQDGKIRRP